MIHKKGSENVNADAKHSDEPTTEENEEYQEANKVGEMKITFASELEGNPVNRKKEVEVCRISAFTTLDLGREVEMQGGAPDQYQIRKTRGTDPTNPNPRMR